MGVRTNVNKVFLIEIGCFAVLMGLLTQSWWVIVSTTLVAVCCAMAMGIIRPLPNPRRGKNDRRHIHHPMRGHRQQVRNRFDYPLVK